MWNDLSQPFYKGMPSSDELPPPEFETVRDVATDDINVQYYSAPTHVGTHVDAQLHFVQGGKPIDKYPLERFAGNGIVLDVSKDDPGEISVEDLESAGGNIRDDDIVLLYTGWDEKYGSCEYQPHPWLSEDAAKWFVDVGPRLVGMDVITPDLPIPYRPGGWIDFPVHRTMLNEEILIAENLANLGKFVGKRMEIFGCPINIRGGDGAPARFAAKKL